ncbi:hypothetical protein SLEP1_g6126 [Rubroshorea leprosula]|uniref:Uncharacterized protein n=1 Tax=Rubroshorea leprosula TaxID=152421 RepID=A0AAV5HU55_9ROSI|nr:hypothetical protein SLEP1_g6126 [Rubroshorea leprosula]
MSSSGFSSSSSLPWTPGSSTARIQVVSKPISDRLLEKFFDVSEYYFDYKQSGIWSPPVRRTAFLSSPGRIFTGKDMLERLRRLMDDRGQQRYTTCFSAFSCF